MNRSSNFCQLLKKYEYTFTYKLDRDTMTDDKAKTSYHTSNKRHQKKHNHEIKHIFIIFDSTVIQDMNMNNKLLFLEIKKS